MVAPYYIDRKLQSILSWSCCSLLLIIILANAPWSLAANTSVPKSGQSIVYLSGDDGDLQKGVDWPSPRFAVNGDGTVTDRLTNLVWLQNANCNNNTLSWSAALDIAATLKNGDCGLSDTSSEGEWRLPNVRELESLVHLGENTPAVSDSSGTGSATDGNPFLFLRQSDYWSSSSGFGDPTKAFGVSLRYGHVLLRPKSNSIYALFVRDNSSGTALADVYATGQSKCFDSAGMEIDCLGSGQDGELQAGLGLSVPRFTDNGDGTVSDNLTGLRWLKNANCLGITTWNTALSWANNLKNGECGLTDGSEKLDWRLPNRKELMSLLDYGRYLPALSNSSGDGQWVANDPFLNVQSLWYLSSSTYDAFTGHAWNVSFQSGEITTETKQYISGFAWAVKDEISLPNATVSAWILLLMD